MNQEVRKKQQIRLFFFNMLAFAIIFCVFGGIIWSQVRSSLYSQIDVELARMKNQESALPGLNGVVTGDTPPELTDNAAELGKNPDFAKGKGDKLNPRMVPIAWDKDGHIVNQSSLGDINNNLFQNLSLKTENLDQIKEVTIDGYAYRSIIFKNTNTAYENTAYIQILINVDAEVGLLKNFTNILAICSIIFWTLSIAASYLLSQRGMRPILLSWRKQSEFVANASHELRTPLTVIQNKLELLLTKPQDKIIEQTEPIAISLSETRRLTKLTTDLLTLARADSDEQVIEKQAVDATPFFQQLTAPYLEIAESQNKELSVQLHNLGSIVIDQARIHQLMVILIDNALKYTQAGDQIEIEVSSTSNHEMAIQVKDTGLGIKAEHKTEVFERFYREDSARTQESGGTGLGLSIAKWIVKAHNGKISVKDNAPKGSIFTVILPIKNH